MKLPALLAALTVLAAMPALPAGAAETGAARSVNEVLALNAGRDGKLRYAGRRVQQCIRQDMVLNADAKVSFLDNENYQIALQNPKEIEGLNLMMDKARLTAYFPRETLLFQSDNALVADEVKDLVLGKLNADMPALGRNYRATLAPESEIVALYPCYKLTFEPVNGFGPNSPPGHRFWIAKETGLIMKEERYWGEDQQPYFRSYFDQVSTTAKPALGLSLPKQVSKLKLAAGTPTEMRRYASADAARKAGKAIFVPAEVPAGFKLKAVDVMSLYGTDIVLLRYNDGLSNMVVTYRTKPNMFLTLMAGAFALALVEKISALSYHAPNNYAVIEKGDYLVYAYGDLWVETLKSVSNSVPVPVPQAAAPGLAFAAR